MRKAWFGRHSSPGAQPAQMYHGIQVPPSFQCRWSARPSLARKWNTFEEFLSYCLLFFPPQLRICPTPRYSCHCFLVLLVVPRAQGGRPTDTQYVLPFGKPCLAVPGNIVESPLVDAHRHTGAYGRMPEGMRRCQELRDLFTWPKRPKMQFLVQTIVVGLRNITLHTTVEAISSGREWELRQIASLGWWKKQHPTSAVFLVRETATSTIVSFRIWRLDHR